MIATVIFVTASTLALINRVVGGITERMFRASTISTWAAIIDSKSHVKSRTPSLPIFLVRAYPMAQKRRIPASPLHFLLWLNGCHGKTGINQPTYASGSKHAYCGVGDQSPTRRQCNNFLVMGSRRPAPGSQW